MIYRPHEEGQGLMEYGLILVIVSVFLMIVVWLLGPAIGNLYSNVIANF